MVLSRILGTRDVLFKTKIHDTDLCRLCGDESETLLHLFFTCPKTIMLLNGLKEWIMSKSGCMLILNTQNFLLGYIGPEFIPINFILFHTKYYIFQCALRLQTLSIVSLKQKLKSAYFEQKMAAELNHLSDKFKVNWSRWSPMFE